MPKDEKSIVRRQPNRIQVWFRETIGELRKVNWPTWQEAKNLTFVVLAVTFGMAAVLGILDYIFSQGVTMLLTIK